MKKITSTLLTLTIIFIIAGCSKEPKASFAFDKGAYNLGETMHLTNTSTDANSYKWTLPDGTTLTSQNIDYQIDTNMAFGYKTFSLEATSKDGKKSSSITNAALVSVISDLPNNSITFGDGYIFYQSNWSVYVGAASSGNYYKISCHVMDGIGFYSEVIYLKGPAAPSTCGYYTFQADTTTLKDGVAALGEKSGMVDGGQNRPYHFATEGHLSITLEHDSIRAVFIKGNTRANIICKI